MYDYQENIRNVMALMEGKIEAGPTEEQMSKAHNAAGKRFQASVGPKAGHAMPGGWKASVPVTVKGKSGPGSIRIYVGIGTQHSPKKGYEVYWDVSTGMRDPKAQPYFNKFADLLRKLEPTLRRYGKVKTTIQEREQLGILMVDHMSKEQIEEYLKAMGGIATKFGKMVKKELY